MYEFPDYLSEYQRILKIPVKKTPQKEISFLKPEEVKFLLEQVEVEKGNGLRDYAMLTLLFTTGIRVSELINIRVRDVSLSSPATLLVHGKGQKSRYVQLIKMAVKIMRDYMSKHGFDKERYFNDWLFKNHCKDRFTRQGVNYIIKKYTEKAGEVAPNVIPSDFSPHKMRHSAAMGLVEADVDLIYIRDLLGHLSVKTTEIYIKANAVRKREAIEAASKEIVAYEEPLWEENKGLKDWLKGFNRR